MKRTRRIEIVRYTRRVTLSTGGDASDHADACAGDVLWETLADAAFEESRQEIDAGDAQRRTCPLIRRIFRLPPVRECYPSENSNKENES